MVFWHLDVWLLCKDYWDLKALNHIILSPDSPPMSFWFPLSVSVIQASIFTRIYVSCSLRHSQHSLLKAVVFWYFGYCSTCDCFLFLFHFSYLFIFVAHGTLQALDKHSLSIIIVWFTGYLHLCVDIWTSKFTRICFFFFLMHTQRTLYWKQWCCGIWLVPFVWIAFNNIIVIFWLLCIDYWTLEASDQLPRVLFHDSLVTFICKCWCLSIDICKDASLFSLRHRQPNLFYWKLWCSTVGFASKQ